MSNLLAVAVGDIRPNPVALRGVDKTTEQYQGLVDSIKQQGIMNAITLRAKTDPTSEESYYEVVDGLHRYTAGVDAGLQTINATIVEMDDDSVLEAQIIANIHRIETKAKDYASQLKRILNNNPMMTASQLATKLGKSITWLEARLSLTKIEDEKISELINGGKIGLVNAYALANLPVDEQKDWVDRAMTDKPEVFVPAVNARKKAITEERRKGRAESPAEWAPTAHAQKLKDIKDEHNAAVVGPALVKQDGASNATEGFALGIAWVLNLDSASVAQQKADHDAREKEKQEARDRKKAEKDKEKAEEAADAATSLL